MHGRRIEVPVLAAMLGEDGLTMAELARLSGVSYSQIKYVMKGERQFRDDTAWKIARVLKCHPDDFSRDTTGNTTERRTSRRNIPRRQVTPDTGENETAA